LRKRLAVVVAMPGGFQEPGSSEVGTKQGVLLAYVMSHELSSLPMSATVDWTLSYW